MLSISAELIYYTKGTNLKSKIVDLDDSKVSNVFKASEEDEESCVGG